MSLTEAASEAICCADNVLVKKAGAPNLTGDKGSPEDAKEEPRHIKAGSILDQRSEANRQTPYEEQGRINITRPELIA